MRSYVMLFVLATGCLGGEGKGEEEELDLLDGKADTHRTPTYHGDIPFGLGVTSALTDDERYHAWTFSLSGDARVDLTTSYALRGQRRTDTVLYLYKEGPNGWGPYIARNDDYGSTTYSKLVRELGEGRYRALVKGHLATTRGKFALTALCEGAGCAPAIDPDACLFGDYYYELRDQPGLQLSQTFKVTPANLATLSPTDQQRLLRAVHESSHTDVTTPAEALSRVDQEEVNLIRILDLAGRRTYVSFEYGAGDNSYGAIFDHHTDERATAINDGDLYQCVPRHEVCLLPADWSALRQSTAFTQTSARVATSASQLTGLTAAQALSAFQDSYDDVTTVADGLSRVDSSQVNVVTFRHDATGTHLDVIEYGAGDTSVGAIFFAGTTDRAGSINDLSIEGCALFE